MQNTNISYAILGKKVMNILGFCTLLHMLMLIGVGTGGPGGPWPPQITQPLHRN